jgi:hypothetical protein
MCIVTTRLTPVLNRTRHDPAQTKQFMSTHRHELNKPSFSDISSTAYVLDYTRRIDISHRNFHI